MLSVKLYRNKLNEFILLFYFAVAKADVMRGLEFNRSAKHIASTSS